MQSPAYTRCTPVSVDEAAQRLLMELMDKPRVGRGSHEKTADWSIIYRHEERASAMALLTAHALSPSEHASEWVERRTPAQRAQATAELVTALPSSGDESALDHLMQTTCPQLTPDVRAQLGERQLWRGATTVLAALAETGEGQALAQLVSLVAQPGKAQDARNGHVSFMTIDATQKFRGVTRHPAFITALTVAARLATYRGFQRNCEERISVAHLVDRAYFTGNDRVVQNDPVLANTVRTALCEVLARGGTTFSDSLTLTEYSMAAYLRLLASTPTGARLTESRQKRLAEEYMYTKAQSHATFAGFLLAARPRSMGAVRAMLRAMPMADRDLVLPGVVAAAAESHPRAWEMLTYFGQDKK